MIHAPLLQAVRRCASVLLGSLALLAALVPGSAHAADWTLREMQEISLKLPAALEPGPDILAGMPEETKKKVKSYAMKMAKDGDEFVVVVARIEYKAGTPNLQGATDGAMKQAAQAMGDKDPKYNVATLKISGLEGRRASYLGESYGKELWMESVLALRGRVIFQVQVISLGDRAADVERVMRSVKIASEALSK